MKGMAASIPARASIGVFAVLTASLPTRRIRSPSYRGLAPKSASIAVPDLRIIFSSSVPRTGAVTPKTFWTLGFVSPAL